MYDEEGNSIFAFHDLDYIPSGYSGITAPYIPTLAGTMRAAAKLMGLVGTERSISRDTASLPPRVICDLGCGDGDFRRSWRMSI